MKKETSVNRKELFYFVRKYFFYLLLIALLPVTIYATFNYLINQTSAGFSLNLRNLKNVRMQTGLQSESTGACGIGERGPGQCIFDGMPVKWGGIIPFLSIPFLGANINCYPTFDFNSCPINSSYIQGSRCMPTGWETAISLLVPPANRVVCLSGRNYLCQNDGLMSEPGAACGGGGAPPPGGGGGECRTNCAICDYNDEQARNQGCHVETFCDGSGHWCWGSGGTSGGETPPQGGGGNGAPGCLQCTKGSCNDDWEYGSDNCAPQTSCHQRAIDACSNRGGCKTGCY